MLRILTPAIVLALMLGFASSASAETFVIVYASETACDLSASPPENPPTAQPIIPPVLVPLGGTLTVDLCFIVWPPEDSVEGETVCSDEGGGTGTESCAEQALFTAAGIEITAFTPSGSQSHDPIVFPHYHSSFTNSSLKIAGGHPLDGLQGSATAGAEVGLSWGTVTLQGTAALGTLQLQSSDGGYVNASMQNRTFPVTIVAQTVGLCGNNTVESELGEECDDGDQILGDGCSPNCRLERTLEVIGVVNAPGSLDVTIGGVAVSLDPLMLNAPAFDVVSDLVANFEEPSLMFTGLAVQVDDLSQPGSSGRFLLTDEPITATLSGNGSGLAAVVPEPGHLVMLAAGIALLLGLERRRSGLERLK